LVEDLRLLRNHGIKSEDDVASARIPGTNAKMNEFQAAMGLCNLEDIDENIRQRKRIYEHYKKGLKGKVKFQKITASRYNYSYMPVCFADSKTRDEVYLELFNNAIVPRKYFFPLTTDSNYYKKDGKDLAAIYSLNVARDISNRVLCLPLYPDLQMSNVDRIIRIVQSKTESE
jgi:dTDP-4-amino-4,6-dideoxygalactose transaminase